MPFKTDARPRTELFVRSIPSDVTDERLGEFFSDFAPVKHAVVVRDKATGDSRGFGFVSFGTAEDAETAKEEGCRAPISGRHVLLIDMAKPRTRNEGDVPAPVNETDDYKREKRRPRILVRNCPWSLRNPAELVKIFSRYGKVIDAYIPRGENNKMSGFAFVTMKRKLHAKRAVEESKGLKIHGREVNVSLAVEKSKWQNKGENANESESDSESESESESDEEDESREKKEDELDADEIKLDDGEDLSEEDEEDGVEDDEDDDDEADEQSKSRTPRLNNNNIVFVRNIPYDADEESLIEHFEQFGPVVYALPVMDKEKNKPRGVAFVGFKRSTDREACVRSAPEISSSSLLVPDDVDPRYVYQGRVLNVTPAVDRDSATKLTEKRANDRLVALGKAPKVTDRRRIFLLNEGRIAPGSKLSEFISPAEMEIRDKSYKLRKTQLSKNPSLHLSMTRLAIRNIPRSMDEKALKALGRKAVVEFATEVKEKKRQPLTQEEVQRSVHYQDSLGDPNKKHGVVKQAKLIQEVKGSGKDGRSRGYGFLELKNHRNALMALRWLNAHKVTREEISAGDVPAEEIDQDKTGRRLVVEFAIENAQVVKRQKERQFRAKEKSLKRKADEEAEEQAEQAKRDEAEAEEEDAQKKRGNFAIGRKRKNKKQRKN